jgi:hypothetical protein
VTPPNKIRFLTVTVLGLIAALVVVFTLVIKANREADRLAPLARKYNEICGGVKAALWVDMTMLHDTGDPQQLTPEQVDEDRRALFRKVGATIGGDDSFVMLQRCIPQPFPMDAWRRCIAANDYACLRALLQQAHDAIPSTADVP